MEGTLVFCKDGILRLKSSSGDTKLVPLVLIQEYLKEDSYPFFLRQIRSGFVLEDGVTIGAFLLCLQPWAEVVSALTDRRVDAYIAELRKPSAEKACFDWIEIRQVYDFRRTMVFEECPEGMDFLEFLNRPNKKIEYANTYSMDGCLSITGAKKDDPTNWSCSASIHELKNVPLVFNREPLAIATNGLFNAKAPGVGKVEHWKNARYVNGKDEDDFLSTAALIEVVIADGLWFNTPQGAINQQEKLKEITAKLDAIGSDEPETETAEEPTEEKQTTIEIAPGAFDGIAAHYAEVKSEWEEMMEVVKSTSTYPFRIGKVEEAVARDNRAKGGFYKKM